MPGVARQGDYGTGHGNFPGRYSSGGSSKTFVGGIPAHRVGDGWPAHYDGYGNGHYSTTVTGSSKVFVGGQALARIGDDISCGGSITTGSSKTFAK
jgi:uncharacterized Zn-binding protein involved in type VI secretion